MSVAYGAYSSPLERRMRQEWEQGRNRELKAAEPLVPAILGSQQGEPQGPLADLARGFSGPGLALGQQSLAFQGQMPTPEAATLRQGGLRAQDFFSQLQPQGPQQFGPQQDPFAGVRTLAPQLEAQGLSGGQFQQFLGGAFPQGGPTLQGPELPEVPFAEQGRGILEEIFGEVGGGREPPQFLAGGPLAEGESIGPLQAGAVPEAIPVTGLRGGGPLKPLEGNPFLTSIFGQEQIEGLRLFIERAPGPISLAAGPVANSVNVLTAPAGVLGAAAAGPRITLIAEGAAITAGTGTAALGADERVQIAAEIAAGIGAPVAAGVAGAAGRAAFRRPTAITGDVLEAAPAPGLREAAPIIEGEVIRPAQPAQARPLGVETQQPLQLTGPRTTEPPGTQVLAREAVARQVAPEAPAARAQLQAPTAAEDAAERLVRERPITGAEARSPTGVQLPDRGTRAAQEVINLKDETLLTPGKVTQFPGIKQALSALNPSVSIDRNALVSYNSRQAVTASLETEFAAQRLSLSQELQAAWDASTPRYTGPSDNVIKNTIKDWADNPEFYADVSPELRAAATAYDDMSNEILARVRGDYNVDIDAFSSGKEGSFYLPTVQARETLDDSLTKVADGYATASISGKSGRSKSRVYDGAYDRAKRNPSFKAESSLAELTSLHDRALAMMAGNETFRLGVGGKTRLEVMAEVHPNLHGKMMGLRRRLANLRGQVGRLNTKLSREIDDFLIDPDGSLSDLADSLDVRVTRGKLKGANIQGVNAEINSVRREIRDLRPGWEAANLDPFVLNKHTFRYHDAEQSVAVDNLLRTKLNIGDGLIDAIDEVRLFNFAADASPLTIQGMLGIIADPLTGARSLPEAMKTLLSPERLLELAAQEPKLVQRFTQSTGRPLGVVGPEFVQQARGIERVPVIGKQLNDRLMATVELIRYNQWKVDQSILRRLNPEMTEAVADAEAANVLSKIIPALNPAERGVSRLQARTERIPFISTSFIGGPPTFIKDAASGMAKITTSRTLDPAARWQQLSGREQLAIIRLTTMAGTLITASVASHIASGWSPEEAVKTVLDPNSPRFISIALGGQRRIPVGGPFRSAIRAFMPKKVGEAQGLPVYAPFTEVPQWLRGKITPAITAPINLARNEDYFGGKIGHGSFPENVLRRVWFAVNNILPLAASEPSEAVRRGEIEPTEPGRLAERAGGQLLGVDVRETSPFDNLREYVQAQRPGQDTPDELVTRLGRQLAAQGDPQAARLVRDFERGGSVFSTSGAARRDALAQEVNQIVEDSGLRDVAIKGLQGNQDASEQFAQEYGDLRRDRAVISQFQSRGVDFPEPSSELGKLVAEYYAISPFRPEFRDPDTTKPDFGAFRAAQKKVLDQIESKDKTLARSIDQRPIFNPDDEPELAQLEARFLDARQVRDKLFETPKVRGLSVKAWDELQDFLRDVADWKRRFQEAKGEVPDNAQVISFLGKRDGKSAGFLNVAQFFSSPGRIPDEVRNPDYLRELIGQVGVLREFFPELYESQLVIQLLNQTAGSRQGSLTAP